MRISTWSNKSRSAPEGHARGRIEKMAVVTSLRLEHYRDGSIGIEERRPRLSWSVTSPKNDWIQKAYQLEIIRKGGLRDQAHAECSKSQLVSWPWTALASRERASVRVRVIGTADNEYTPWSTPILAEAGLSTDDWSCSLIEPLFKKVSEQPMRPIVFSAKTKIESTVHLARLYITAHGIYEAYLNGNRVGDHALAPGWTSYHHRLHYQTFDVTPHVKSNADNEICIIVSEGWFRGRLGWNGGRRDIYGSCVGVVAMMVLEDENGTVEVWGTDSSWMWSYGPHLAASLYDGESYDSRIHITEGMKDAVRERAVPRSITSSSGPPVRRIQELPVLELIHTPGGKWLLDFGQNLTGWVRIEMVAKEACKIEMSHAEVLERGELCRRPLRDCKATDTIIIAPEIVLSHEPAFTFHGFRYVQVDGWPGTPDPKSFTAVVIHSDMERTGHFKCSNALINRLHENIVWSMRGNFLSLPIDCPQRDERLGWTGDINIFAETGNFVYNTAGLLASWLRDVAAEQKDNDGIIPLTVPNVVPGLEKEAHAIWGDVAVMLPWSLYLSFGDKDILASQFESMESWLNAIPRSANGLWNYHSDWKLGDWLSPETPPDDPGKAATDPSLVSDAFLVHITSLMVAISTALNREDSRNRYSAEHATLLKAFTEEYVTPSGRLASDTQTAYALALMFSLYTLPEQETKASERLQWLTRRISRFQIATGFAGTPYLGLAMTKVGLTNLFYRMLFEQKCPSWLYPITMGATTVWERWDSMLASGAVNPGEMTSFNHYALGSVANWIHRVILGLKAIEPGWSTFAVEPVPGGSLKWAEGSYRSSYGECGVRWVADTSGEGLFWIQTRVPPNTRARITLPGQHEPVWVGSGTHELRVRYVAEPWPPRAIYARNMDQTEDLLGETDR